MAEQALRILSAEINQYQDDRRKWESERTRLNDTISDLRDVVSHLRSELAALKIEMEGVVGKNKISEANKRRKTRTLPQPLAAENISDSEEASTNANPSLKTGMGATAAAIRSGTRSGSGNVKKNNNIGRDVLTAAFSASPQIPAKARMSAGVGSSEMDSAKKANSSSSSSSSTSSLDVDGEGSGKNETRVESRKTILRRYLLQLGIDPNDASNLDGALAKAAAYGGLQFDENMWNANQTVRGPQDFLPPPPPVQAHQFDEIDDNKKNANHDKDVTNISPKDGFVRRAMRKVSEAESHDEASESVVPKVEVKKKKGSSSLLSVSHPNLRGQVVNETSGRSQSARIDRVGSLTSMTSSIKSSSSSISSNISSTSSSAISSPLKKIETGNFMRSSAVKRLFQGTSSGESESTVSSHDNISSSSSSSSTSSALTVNSSGAKFNSSTNWKSVQSRQQLFGHLDSVRSISLFSGSSTSNSSLDMNLNNNNNHILVSGSEDGLVKIWKLHPRKWRATEPTCTFRGHDGPVFSVTAVPGANAVVSAGYDGLILAWDLAGVESKNVDGVGYRCLENSSYMECHTDVVWKVATPTDVNTDKVASISSDGSLCIWHLGRVGSERDTDIQCDLQLMPPVQVQSIFSDTISKGQAKTTDDIVPTSLAFLSNFDARSVCIVSYNNGKAACISSIDVSDCSNASGDAITTIGFDLSNRGNVNSSFGDECVYDTVVGEKELENVAFTAHDNGIIRMIDFRAGRVVRSISAHETAATSLALSPNQRYIISGSHDGNARIWSIDSGSLVQELKDIHACKSDEAVHSLAWHPSGYIVSAGADAIVNIYQ
eukprot:g3486.t1